MTLLMVWTDKPNDAETINIASDSRLSDGPLVWDYATKIHRLYPTTTYLGYCGGSFVALSAITSATSAIACSDHLYKDAALNGPALTARVEAIHLHIENTFPLIPTDWNREATLLLADYDHRKKAFSAFTIEMTDAGVGKPIELDLLTLLHHFQ